MGYLTHSDYGVVSDLRVGIIEQQRERAQRRRRSRLSKGARGIETYIGVPRLSQLSQPGNCSRIL